MKLVVLFLIGLVPVHSTLACPNFEGLYLSPDNHYRLEVKQIDCTTFTITNGLTSSHPHHTPATKLVTSTFTIDSGEHILHEGTAGEFRYKGLYTYNSLTLVIKRTTNWFHWVRYQRSNKNQLIIMRDDLNENGYNNLSPTFDPNEIQFEVWRRAK